MILNDAVSGLVPLLFPYFTGVQVEQVESTTRSVRFVVAVCSFSAECPTCGYTSDRVHSRYERTVADRGISDREAVLRVRARRFRCTNNNCPCQTSPGTLTLWAD